MKSENFTFHIRVVARAHECVYVCVCVLGCATSKNIYGDEYTSIPQLKR